MSKIGKQPVIIPEDIKVELDQNKIKIVGPKGTLEKFLPKNLEFNFRENVLTVKPLSSDKQIKALWGTWRSLINNMVIGVKDGFSKELEYKGVGYKAVVEGDMLNLALGFSHPVNIKAPEGIDFKTEKNSITISGIDKELVGQVAAKIRKLRPPEPYKGKGIKYKDEVIRRKEGKKVVGSGF
ncbi:50S ribosomal protein L6 [bacterium]|nr:MAG: 50S ribosomal protein L6 [bacterium]